MIRASRLVVAVLPAIGVVELALHFFFAARAPAFDAYADIESAVRAMRRPGDVVIVAPHWADPLARRALGDALMPMRDEGRPDVSRYAGAVEISILGQHSHELEGFTEVDRRSVGKFELRRLDNPSPANVVFDFTDHIDPAFADVRGTDPEVPCHFNPHADIQAGGLGGHPTWPSERFECPGGAFFNVGVTIIADQHFLPRRCIWSHPFARGELVTRFANVPLGDVIRGHGGLYWITEREKKGAPIELSIRVDGEEVGSYEHVDGDGWSAFSFPLGAHAHAAAATVEFAASSPNNRDRHFCFEADTR